MTNNDDLALKLKAAAEMATPGEWERGDGKHGGELLVYCDDALGSAVCEATSTYNSIPKLQRISNLTFIATANPANILTLLAERDDDKKVIADSVVLFETLRQRIAELEALTSEQDKRLVSYAAIATKNASEARTVSVKIKPPTIGRAYSALAHVWTVQEVREACAAAGIKLEVGE
jgi:hypothetical protein